MLIDRLGVVIIMTIFSMVAGGRLALADTASAPAGLDAARVAPETASEKPGGRVFDVWEIAVDGNSVIEDSDIQEALAPYLGIGKTVHDVDKAREALASLYREMGFQTVSVGIAVESRKTIADGLIILKVDEGRIHKLSISGARYFSVDQIRAQAPSLKEGVVPDFEAVQKEVAELDRLADRQVSPSLKRDEATGNLDVDIEVTDSLPLHGMFEINNRYSSGTTHFRATAMLSYDNMWQRGDGFSLMMQTAPEQQNDGTVLFASYLARFADPGFTLQLTALKSDSDVAAVGGTNVIGSGKSAGIKGIWQLSLMRQWVQGISFGVEYKDFENDVLLGGSKLETPLKYYPLNFTYNAAKQHDSGSSRYEINLMSLLPRLGSNTAAIDKSRYAARQQMHALRGSAAWTFYLPKSFEAATNISAQITDVPLVSNEQISAGGMDSVRGYLEAETSGDRGALATVEFRTPSITQMFADKQWASHVHEGRMFVFADAAHVSLTGPLPDSSQRNHSDLYSAGVGVNMGFLSHANAKFEWSNPLVNGPTTKKNDSRLLFRVWATF